MSTVGLLPQAPYLGKEGEEKGTESSLHKKKAPAKEETPKKKKESIDQPMVEPHPSEPAIAVEEEAEEEDLEAGRQRSRFREISEFFPEDSAAAQALVGKEFGNEDELGATLKNLGLVDERIALGDDGRAYFYMPGEDHNNATRYILHEFSLWARGVKGVGGENTNVELGAQLPGAPLAKKRKKPKARLPDVSLWGRSKCALDEDKGTIMGPVSVNPGASPNYKVHPHVVIQVSNFNDVDYEYDAINDLATRAFAGQGPPPSLAVMIKSRQAGHGAQAGFDIYYLPAGTFFDDAVSGTSGASHVVYNHGGPDVVVSITEADLGGINLGFWESMKDFFLGGSKDFELSMAKLFRQMFQE